MEIDGETLRIDDILVFREAREGTNTISDRFVSIDLDCQLNESLIREGLAREVISRIQKSRKDEGFNVIDRINIKVDGSPELTTAIAEHESHIMKETLAMTIEYPVDEQLPLSFEIDEYTLNLSVERIN